MISKMSKYSFILLSEESEAFLEKLQELGVVDITRSTKPVDEQSSAKLEKILKIRQAISMLESLDYSKDADYEAIRKAADATTIEGCKMQNTLRGKARIDELNAAIATAQKSLKQVSPWGEYDKASVDALSEKGIAIHYYCVSDKKFDQSWESICPLEVISREGGNVWFVTVSKVGEPYEFPVSECSAPELSAGQAKAKIKELEQEVILEKGKLVCLKEKHLPHMREGLANKTADLDRYLAANVATEAAEGYICTYEGFAPTEENENLTKAFDEMGVIYFSEDAKEEDNPPIKLKNNKFNQMFESLTGMYGMPVYGEWDPTPILGIFFMLFFAMCMGDAGYGVTLLIYGILQEKKIVNIGMFSSIGKLIAVLGAATAIVGFFLGTAFGINLAEAAWVPDALKSVMLSGDVEVAGSSYSLQMILAICIGVFHLCLAMTIKAVLYTQRFGFKETISAWGWLLLIVGGLIVAILAMVGFLPAGVTKILLIGIGAVSALAIYIFNKPGRNPLINIGAGLWDTYNMATGILGDVLSYIRLYALGLAGGMLGGAFNNLGGMILGDHPTWHWLPYVIILFLGHTLNLLMSSLGAFVHPLRLTFVEYFKNSGYEGKGSEYNPLKK